MELYYGIGAIAGICVLVLLMGLVKQKTQVIFVFVLRCIAGSVGISAVNELFKSQGIAVSAGINPVTVLTVGILGICGFALIYGILLYKFL
ncbi:MAG: transcriptional regulator [Lachnospiraceae bacterium]|nr:transcriptional regulator [Lachnospiraceae bacterium]